MRTIKFRGKSLKDGEFEYGSLLTYQRSIDIEGNDRVFAAISYEGLEPIEVEPNTIGQYTGLVDKNGKEIYEGDIVTMFANINKLSDPMLSNAEPKYCLTTIVYDDAAFKITFEGKPDAVLNHYSGAMVKYMEVVGNIHDNPELIKEK